ncbi:MAG: hypothetical protein M3132_13370 [Actinomycetia bacterium]|nr:hypothetical protein [Actinomycetes bacterium]
MNDADISLILSLAHGELDGQDRLAALERVEASPELADELAVQIEMIDAVQDMPDITAMTEPERATLRSDLIEQLRLDPAPVAIPTKRTVPWWQPVFGLASAAALVVVIVVVPGMLSSSNDSNDVAFTEVSSDLDGSSDGQGGSADSETERFATSESGSAGLDTAPDGAVSEDTASIAEDNVATTGAPAAPLPPLLFRVPDQREDEFSDIAAKGTSAATIREQLVNSGFSTEDASVFFNEALASCVADLAVVNPGTIFVPLGNSDQGTVYVGVNTGEGIDDIIEIAVDSCSVVTPTP